MKSDSKIRVYTNGMVAKGAGAYAYVVLESKECGDVRIGDGFGRMSGPSKPRAEFAQAGPATDEMRMQMRAVYEGVRHCPDNAHVEVYGDNFLLECAFESVTRVMENGDIAERYRQYVAAHKISVSFVITNRYRADDLPCNDDDEWTWYAYHLCEKAIKRYNKGNKENAE